MPYTTILIDDEQDCLNLLKWQLETYCPDMKIIAACNAAEDGLQAIEKMQPDVIFLDIQMPFINGFELLRRIPKINFEVVFTTAYDEYALKALKINALDYLLKPIAKDELLSSVEKFKNRVKSKNKGDDQPLLLQLLNLQNNPSKKIAIPIQDSILFLNIDDILYIKSESNYSTIQLKNLKSILASKTLRHFEDLLNGNQFYRIHASYLINLVEITKYKKTEGGSIVMSNGEEIKISRGRKDDFIKLL